MTQIQSIKQILKDKVEELEKLISKTNKSLRKAPGGEIGVVSL